MRTYLHNEAIQSTSLLEINAKISKDSYITLSNTRLVQEKYKVKGGRKL